MPNSADFIYFSPRAEIYDFGERVSPVSDLDSDDIPELRIRGYSEVEPGVEQEHTFIVSGVDGFPLYEIIGYDPFDPWATQPGDVAGRLCHRRLNTHKLGRLSHTSGRGLSFRSG